ncbi:MAG: glycine zipper 2TM domain-containing protein [Novosphingobium sp.]|jgi:hypothetical protein
MHKTLFIAPLALALATTPALADPPPWAPAHGAREKHVYDGYGRYVEPRPITRNSYIWRGRDGRYYCRRDNGTTGLVIGAGVGALAGHELAGPGDKTLGTILGAVIGGALGRAIDRGDLKCR